VARHGARINLRHSGETKCHDGIDEWQVCDHHYLSENSMNKLYEQRNERPADLLTPAIAS
jgi:hypothetical protein